MANHPSAEKRHRQSVKRAARNQAVRSQVRTEVKKLSEQAKSGPEIAKAVGISEQSVFNVRKALGLTKKRK